MYACRVFEALRRLRRDEDGSILILFTLVAVVMIGMTGLALDAGRRLMLNSELQDAADAAALAGAYELDGAADAITRAIGAAQNLLTNNPKWADTGTSGVQIASVTFAGPTNPDVATVDPKEARYIRVQTVTRGVIPTLVRAVGGTTTANTNATATAESSLVACNTQPMMLCNPMEPNPFTATPGQMFKFKPKGAGSTTFSPGDFGLLDPPGYTAAGAPDIRALLSQQSPPICYGNSINPRPGQATNMVADGINVRFDHIPSGGGPNIAAMDLRPAPNVIDGIWPKNGTNCNQMEPHPTSNVPFPDDPAGTTTQMAGVDVGSGPAAADLDAYWNHHHGAAWPAGLPRTRYAGYLRELGLNGAAPAWVAGTEPNAKQCSSAAAADHKRRVVSTAIVDCQYWAVRGNAVNNIWSNKYADFFITRSSPDGSVTTEFIELKTAGPGSGLHRIVQLVR